MADTHNGGFSSVGEVVCGAAAAGVVVSEVGGGREV